MPLNFLRKSIRASNAPMFTESCAGGHFSLRWALLSLLGPWGMVSTAPVSKELQPEFPYWMDLESLETIAILDAQRDYMDMNEEDALNEENAMREGETEMQELEQSDTQTAERTQATQPRKRHLTSKVWNDFTSVGVESDGKERGQCNHCGKN
ncbi:hypothetical protein N665_0146s0001 [Sinapis alba]|nr:hypothetical protein N665_0146s0001 [Sinapis alba]